MATSSNSSILGRAWRFLSRKGMGVPSAAVFAFLWSLVAVADVANGGWRPLVALWLLLQAGFLAKAVLLHLKFESDEQLARDRG